MFGFLGDLVNNAFRFFQMKYQNSLDKDLMSYNNAMQLNFEKNKYLAQVQGMKAAGINPAITSEFSMGWTARN